MERTGAPAIWRKPPANRYSRFLSLPLQRPTLQIENVMGYLPEHLKDLVKAAMRGAFRLSAREGMALGEAGPLARAGISQRRRELARRLAGDVHRQPLELVPQPG